MKSKSQFNFTCVAAYARELISQERPRMTLERYHELKLCKTALKYLHFEYGFIGEQGDEGRDLLRKLIFSLEEMETYYVSNGRQWEE